MKDTTKKPMNRFVKIGIIIGIVLLVLGPVKDMMISSAVVVGARAVAGVDVKIGYFSLSLIGQSVKIKDFRVFHPKGFPSTGPMVDIPEIAVKVDVPSIFKNVLHVRYLRLDLKEVRVIRNAQRLLNVNTLAEKFKVQKSEQEMKMLFDLVSLNIGRVVMEDYSSGGDKPKVTTYEVNIKDKEFRNVKSPAELGAAVMFQALAPAGLDGAFSLGAKVINQTIDKVGVQGLNKVTGFLNNLGK